MSWAKASLTILYIMSATFAVLAPASLPRYASHLDSAAVEAEKVFVREWSERDFATSPVAHWYRVHRIRLFLVTSLSLISGVLGLIGSVFFLATGGRRRGIIRAAFLTFCAGLLTHYGLALYAGRIPIRYLEGCGGLFFYTAFLIGIPVGAVGVALWAWMAYHRVSVVSVKRDTNEGA